MLILRVHNTMVKACFVLLPFPAVCVRACV